jgi:hypothetical protein
VNCSSQGRALDAEDDSLYFISDTKWDGMCSYRNDAYNVVNAQQDPILQTNKDDFS